MRLEIYRRILLAHILNIVLVFNMTLRRVFVFVKIIRHNNNFGLMLRNLQSLYGGVCNSAVVYIDLGLVMVDDLGGLTGG